MEDLSFSDILDITAVIIALSSLALEVVTGEIYSFSQSLLVVLIGFTILQNRRLDRIEERQN